MISWGVNCSDMRVKPRMSEKRIKTFCNCPPRAALLVRACREASEPRYFSRVWRWATMDFSLFWAVSRAVRKVASMRDWRLRGEAESQKTKSLGRRFNLAKFILFKETQTTE